MAAQKVTNGSSVAYYTTDAAGGQVKIAQNLIDQGTGVSAGPFNANAPTLRFRCAALGTEVRFDQQTINDLLPGLTAFANTGVLS